MPFFLIFPNPLSSVQLAPTHLKQLQITLQDLVLAPLLFILYTADPEVVSHQYADDVQAYTHGQAAEATSMVQKLLRALLTLDTWLKSSEPHQNPVHLT